MRKRVNEEGRKARLARQRLAHNLLDSLDRLIAINRKRLERMSPEELERLQDLDTMAVLGRERLRRMDPKQRAWFLGDAPARG
jgi:hypothetical protein